MDKEKYLPKRKSLRIKEYDYSSKGAYFITICTKDRKRILSDIINPNDTGAFENPPTNRVGGGAHDAPLRSDIINPNSTGAYDATLPKPQIRLTEIGRIVEKHLLSSENIPGVKIDRYVIMPDHIHVIVFLQPDEYATRKDGSSWAPTPTNEMLPHTVSTFKRFCSKELGSNIFQRGYADHIIRDREDYETRIKYICENPMRRYRRDLNSGE